MTKTTDSRQVRLLIGGILSKHGIDNLQLEIEIAGAVKRYYDETKSGGDKANVRERILASMEAAAARATKTEQVLSRVQKALGFDVSGSRFDQMIEFIIRAEDNDGQTIEQFREWWDEQDKFKRPALWKIADRPAFLRELWPGAFSKEWQEATGEEFPTL